MTQREKYSLTPLGKAIKKGIIDNNITQSELAEKVGTTVSICTLFYTVGVQAKSISIKSAKYLILMSISMLLKGKEIEIEDLGYKEIKVFDPSEISGEIVDILAKHNIRIFDVDIIFETVKKELTWQKVNKRELKNNESNTNLPFNI